VAVNYADHNSQCYVRVPLDHIAGPCWRLTDLLGEAQYERNGEELASRGLYLDMTPWQYQVFEMTAG
jgi:hypothetical protein